jgi:hypothetical protein
MPSDPSTSKHLELSQDQVFWGFLAVVVAALGVLASIFGNQIRRTILPSSDFEIHDARFFGVQYEDPDSPALDPAVYSEGDHSLPPPEYRFSREESRFEPGPDIRLFLELTLTHPNLTGEHPVLITVDIHFPRTTEQGSTRDSFTVSRNVIASGTSTKLYVPLASLGPNLASWMPGAYEVHLSVELDKLTSRQRRIDMEILAPAPDSDPAVGPPD